MQPGTLMIINIMDDSHHKNYNIAELLKLPDKN